MHTMSIQWTRSLPLSLDHVPLQAVLPVTQVGILDCVQAPELVTDEGLCPFFTLATIEIETF